MSDIQVVKLVDSSLNYNDQNNKFGVQVSVNENMTQYVSSDNSYSNVTFNFTPISGLISNKLLFKYKYRLALVGVAGGTNLLEPGFFQIEPNIFLQCSNVITNIDTAGQTIQASKILPCLLPYRHVIDDAYQTITPTNDYTSLIGTSYSDSDTFSNNYIYRCDDVDMHGFERYRNTFFRIISNTPTTAVIEIEGIARIPTGLTQFMTDKQEYYLMTKNINITMSFNNLANTFKYLIAAPGSSSFSSIKVVDNSGLDSVGFSENPALRVYSCNSPIPPTKSLYYNTATQYSTYIQNYVQDLSPGASTTLSFNNLQIQQIPNNLYLIVRDGVAGNWKTGNGLAIESINVQAGNDPQNIFKFNQFDLWEVSRKFGYVLDYQTFKNCTVICMPFSMLFNNNTFYSSSTNQVMNFTLDINVKNPSASQLVSNIEVIVVTQQDGVMTTSMSGGGTKNLRYNFVGPESFLSAPILWSDTCEAKRGRGKYNGGWLSALLSAIPAVISGIQTVGQIAKPIVKQLVCDQPQQGAGLMQSSGGTVMSRSALSKRVYR